MMSHTRAVFCNLAYRWFLQLVIAVMIGSLTGSHAKANVIYDSYIGTSYGSVGQLWLGTYADSFSTGSTPLELSSITFSLAHFGGDDTSLVTAFLLSDNSTSPGSTLLTIGSVSDASGTYTIDTSYALSADTRYWIELSQPQNNSSSGAAWQFGSGMNVAGEYIDSKGYIDPTYSVNPSYNGAFLLEINAFSAATPEPSQTILLMLGTCGFALFNKMLRKRSLQRA